MKFGGSSLESAFAIRKVCSIVQGFREENPVVVVSAIGKTTNRLCELEEFRAAGNSSSLWKSFEHLKRFHVMLCEGLATSLRKELETGVSALFAKLKDCLRATGPTSPAHSDTVLSFGERLSSIMMTAALRQKGLQCVHLDSRRAIITNDHFTNAAPRFVETNALLRRLIRADQITVMGGFIGATENGEPTTLGRGGSDYTAAIVGGAMCAEEVQIWTDVDGMLTCDPRVVSNGHCLRSISYSEAEEMAKSGAKVLHPATVAPAIRQRIPIVIRNSRNPDAVGTSIVPRPQAEGMVLSIACRTGVTQLNLVHPSIPNTPEFADRLWNIFKLQNVEFEVASVSRECFTVLVDHTKLTSALYEVLGETLVEVLPDRAVITLVGHHVGQNPKNFLRASRAVQQIHSEAFSLAVQANKFGFVVPQANLAEVANQLHREFFATPDPTLFEVNRYQVLSAEPGGEMATSVPARAQ